MYFAQDKLGSCLSFAKALRTIHINYPPGGSGSPVLPQSQALSFLNKFSPTITQFGCNAQVWQVSSVRWTRGMLLKADGLYCPDIANDRGCWRWFDGSAQDSGPIRESWYSWTVSRRAIIDTRDVTSSEKSSSRKLVQVWDTAIPLTLLLKL